MAVPGVATGAALALAATLGYHAPQLADAARDYWQQKVQLRRSGGQRAVPRVDGSKAADGGGGDNGQPALVAAIREALLVEGCCVVHDLLSPAHVGELLAELHGASGDAYRGDDGSFYGARTARGGPHQLGASAALQRLAVHPLVLGAAQEVLGRHCKRLCLKLAQTIAVEPGQVGQALHREDSLWPIQDVHAGCHDMDTSIDALWALTPFTKDNGATRLIPGSHRWGRIAGNKRSGIAAWQHDFGTFGDELEPRWTVQAEMPAGSVLLFLGGTIHAAAANLSDEVRRGLIIGYNLGWLSKCDAYECIVCVWPCLTYRVC